MGCASSKPLEEEDVAGVEPALTVERSRVSALALASGVERQFSTTARARTLPGYKPRAALETQAEEEDASAGASGRGGVSLDPSAVLQYMNALLLELQMVSGSAPGLVLPELAERLVGQLGAVDLCRVEAIIEVDGQPAAGVLLAAHGVGAPVCEETPVVRGDAAAAHCWALLRKRGGPGAICIDDASACLGNGEPLPQDFRALHLRAGLTSFLSVLVSAGTRVIGSLTIAARAPAAFSEAWWQPVLTMSAAALLPHLRNRQLVSLCRMMVAVDAEQDAAEAASHVIYGVSQFMRGTTNLSMAVRLGLVHHDRVLIIEQDPQDAAALHSGGSGSASGPGGPRPFHRVVASDIPLAGTLLGSALGARKARFVSDCALYFQRALAPAADVFTPASQLVSSLVVIPFCDAAPPLGGIYFALDAPDDFSQLQAPILGVVSMASVLLQRKLGGKADMLQERIQKATNSPLNLADARAAEHALASSGSNQNDGAGGSGAQQSSLSFTSKRLNTDAIMKAVQLKLSMSHSGPDVHQSGAGAARCYEDLQLEEALGRGGYGVCYKAHFRGATVAVKVLYAREHQREAMKDAVEMAVLSHMRHPGIVAVYSCFTDMIEEAMPTAGKFPRYRPAQPEDTAATCNVIVMEYCDMGTLRDAVKRGLFHVPISKDVVAVDLLKVIKVLLEVARSVDYLHERKLLHCDLKLDNVLLKSDLTHDLGFATKLADFGLTKMMNEHLYVQNRSGSGTITHLAPEVLHAGSKLTAAVDAYAFAVLAYELYTGNRAFAGLRQDKVIEAVAHRGARPPLPPDAPAPLAALVAACWAHDAGARPAFPQIVAALREMLASIQAAEEEEAAAAAAAAAAAVARRSGNGAASSGVDVSPPMSSSSFAAARQTT